GYDRTDADYVGYHKISQLVEGYYGHLVYPLSQQFSLSTGLRYAAVDDTNYSLTKTHDDSINAKELGVNYQIDNGWRLFARYAEGFRFANADENGLVLTGVNFLEVQTSESYETGVAWAGERAHVSYSLYQMTLNDEITFDAIAYANINLPDTERQGFQFDGGLTLSDEIALTANYTYTDAEVTAGSFKGKEVPYVSAHVANLGIVFTPIDTLSFVLDSTYTGSRYLSGDETNSYPKVAPVQLFNLNVIWQVAQVEIAGRIKNVTNERHSGFQGYSSRQAAKYYYPQPERNYEASITYRF
ncbi:TonB-dependent receptor domain-containing protein, partial [Cellvibrio sp.]